VSSTHSSESETRSGPAFAAACHFVRLTRARQRVAHLTADITEVPEALRILGSMSETLTDKGRCAIAGALVERLITELDSLLGLGWKPLKPLSQTTASESGPEKS